MLVGVIDDDQGVLDAVSAMLRQFECHVLAFSDAPRALDNLTAGVDLVIADIDMPQLNGFNIAEAVALRFGASPPRTLLMSGAPHERQLTRYPPSTVIGILPKPISFVDFRRVFTLLACTRTCCPGAKMPICPYVVSPGETGTTVGGAAPLCWTPQYTRCVHYDSPCGMTLRYWITQSGHKND